jgi:LacI family transcriptional regulator
MSRNQSSSRLIDVAKKAGVSRQTVSRYLNKRDAVAVKTSKKVEKAIQELGYHPSAAARNLRHQRTMTIGLALYSVDDLGMGQSELFALKLGGILKVLSPRGYGLQVVETNPEVSQSRKGTYYLDKIRAGEIDGIIISDFYLPTKDILSLYEMGAPFSIIDHFVPEVAGRCVMTDVYLEGFRLTAALLEKGHQRFAYCGWAPGRGLANQFREGMVQAMLEMGGNAEVVVDVNPASDGDHGMMERLSRALSGERAPTAAVCNDDWITGLVALLAERGVPSAENFQLAGVSLKPNYLDSERVALAATPMDRQLGIAGARLLLGLLDGKPEGSQPVNVGPARFVAPSFPYLAHPRVSASSR